MFERPLILVQPKNSRVFSTISHNSMFFQTSPNWSLFSDSPWFTVLLLWPADLTLYPRCRLTSRLALPAAFRDDALLTVFPECIRPLTITILTCTTFWTVTIVKELCPSAVYMLCHLIFTTILRWVFLLYFLDARTLLKARHTINSISAFQGKERKENDITLNVDIKSQSHVSFWKVKMCVCVFVEGNRK